MLYRMNPIQEKSLNVAGMNEINIFSLHHDGRSMIQLRIMVGIQLLEKLLHTKNKCKLRIKN